MHCGTGAQTSLDQGTCDHRNVLNNSENMTIKSQARKKSTYRHIPHSQKPPHLVARRNARERKRVQAVNNAFLRLRKHVPFENKHKRLSKVKTLQSAIDYITNLQNMIEDYDRQTSSYGQRMTASHYHTYKQQDQRLSVGINCNWIQGNENFNKQPSAREQEKGMMPEYGTLGMNEISSLPNV